MTGALSARVRPVGVEAHALAAVTQTLAEHAPAHDRDGSFPWPGITAVHDAGLLTATVDQRYGGRGLSAREHVDVFLALGAGDPSVALITAMTLAQHAHQAESPWWPEALYEELLGRDSPQLLNAIRAEPELGAPARGGLPATVAHRTADGWRVVGRKGFATGSEGLAYHLVWVVTDEDEPRIGHVIVPGEQTRIVKTWDHLGMRATSTHDVIYDAVVPYENFSGDPVGSVPNNRYPVTGTALAVPSLYVGVAAAALGAFVRFAQERVPTSLGRPIATLERIQSVAGEAKALILRAELVLGEVAASIDAGAPRHDAVRLVKTLTSRDAIAAVELLVAAIGNPGLTRGQPLERHLRDVLCARPHPPQDDAAFLGAGRALLQP